MIATSMRPLLQTSDLSIGYARSRRADPVVASGINQSLHAGELVCLLGPNGAGKSTLMRTLAGMQPPLQGRVLLNGVDVRTVSPRVLARHLSIVLTERIDVGNLAVWTLVALGRYPYTDWAGRLTQEDEAVVLSALDAVGARHLAQRPVSELSDGERQKAMVARALAQEPQLILLDEPTAYLDLPRRVEMMSVLRGLARRHGRAVLLSTHDLDLALRNADYIWLLPQEGPLVCGTPEDLVLNGAFARTFSSTTLLFNTFDGSFQTQEQPLGTVALFGDGVAARWTERALARVGIRIESTADSVTTQIRVTEEKGLPIWRIVDRDVETVYHSIDELLQGIRKSINSTQPPLRQSRGICAESK